MIVFRFLSRRPDTGLAGRSRFDLISNKRPAVLLASAMMVSLVALSACTKSEPKSGDEKTATDATADGKAGDKVGGTADDKGGENQWTAVTQSKASGGVAVTGRVVPQDGALSVESARVQGRVMAILKREGDSVVIGQPLYEVSSAECFSLAEEKRVAVSKGLQELITGVERREKQLGLKLQGDRCFVVASHAGVVTKRMLESGASFNQGDATANILDTHRLTVELDVAERDQSTVHAGQSVSLQFASSPGETLHGVIQTVVPAIDPATRTTKMRLAPLKLPKAVSLEALVFGEVENGLKDSVLAVPASALVFAHNQQFVIAGPAQRPAAVAVQVVNENDLQSSVRPLKAGTLKAGDLVAARGAVFLLRKLMDQEEALHAK